MPNYKIDAIEVYPIYTSNVSQADAIKNIKYALMHGGGVILWFQIPAASEKDFTDFWQFEPA